MSSRTVPGPKPSVLVISYAAVAFAPLALAAVSAAREEMFWRELGIGVGLVAFAMFTLQFILSGRLEWLSGRVGIDGMMRWHHLAARTLAILILIHPILFVIGSNPQSIATGASRLAVMMTSPANGSGVAAWIAAIILVIASLLRRRIPIPYEAWRLIHATLGIIAVGFSAHHAFRIGLYSGYPAVAFYWCLLIAVAAVFIFFIYGIKPLALRRKRYRITRSAQLGARTWELAMEPVSGEHLDFAAGQFAWFSFGRFPWPGLDHPFSIASSPAQSPTLAVLVNANGDFTGGIGQLRVGSSVYVDGPHGNFTLRGRDAKRLCMIAGGIGIAPILSMLRDLHAHRDPRPISLIYAARSENDLVSREEIDRIAATLDLRVVYVLEHAPATWAGARGLVNRQILETSVDKVEDTLFFLCGPTRMMLTVERWLANIGVPWSQIVYERFDYD